MKSLVVAGIGTGVGKTLVAAILTEVLQADYWKPVQAGNLNFTDTDTVRSLITNTRSVIHSEVYSLQAAISPHAAAELDNVEIELLKLSIPANKTRLIIELAGGIMVPLNKKQLNIDLLVKWNLPVILVSQNYLGSINHTLLSVEALKSRGIQLAGIIFNGESRSPTEEFILEYTAVRCLARINPEKEINKHVVKQYADILKEQLNNSLL
ncbi:MAG: dethiobiotin synthase [Chitinophagaceae bacterium]